MTAIGANFIHFAAGITTIWASTGLYFLSYFHVSGTDNVTSSVIVMLTILPLCLIMIFAAKISKLCGDCNTVRCCAAILMVSQILPNFIFNEAIMTICYFIIPFSMFGLSLISALRCLRTVFPKKYKSHEIICLVSFASGAILWNVILKDLINPNNAKAGEPDKFGSVYLPLGAVTNMVFRVNGVFFVCGVITMVGSLLLQEKRQRDISVQHDEQGDTSRVISIKIIPENASAKQTKTLEEYPQRLTKPE